LKNVAEAICPDYIFHLAAATMHGGISCSRSEVIETNFLGTVNMIDACNDVAYRCFVNTGDSFEYGPKQEPMKESDTCHPDTIDGIAKLSASLYGQYVAQKKNRPIVTLRLFSVFGPRDDPRRLIPKVLQGALTGAPLMLSRPEIARDYVYVDDLVDLYLALIQNPPNRIAGEIFNAASGRQTTIGEVVDLVFRVTNSKTEVRWNTFAPAVHDTARWQADMTKTFGVVSWRPRFTFERALREIVRQQAAYNSVVIGAT